MIAEIHGKMSDSNVDRNQRLEDELTGNVFGTLRYMPYSKGLKQILECVKGEREADIRNVIENIVDERPCVSFWDKKDWGEIDVHIETEDVSINIEVKYHSSESGGDQLKKYSDNIINEWGKGKNCILLILAPAVEAAGIYKTKLDSKQINSEVKFGYLCWEDIYDRLKELSETKVETYNCYEQIMTDDVLKFLKCRGLDSFRDFDLLKDDTLKDIIINKDEFEKFKRDNVEWEKEMKKRRKENGKQ